MKTLKLMHRKLVGTYHTIKRGFYSVEDTMFVTDKEVDLSAISWGRAKNYGVIRSDLPVMARPVRGNIHTYN